MNILFTIFLDNFDCASLNISTQMNKIYSKCLAFQQIVATILAFFIILSQFKLEEPIVPMKFKFQRSKNDSSKSSWLTKLVLQIDSAWIISRRFFEVVQTVIAPKAIYIVINSTVERSVMFSRYVSCCCYHERWEECICFTLHVLKFSLYDH